MKRSYFRRAAAALLAATLALSAVPSQALAQVTYAAATRDVPTWTVDGTSYDSEEAANAAADALRPEVTSTTSQADVWKTSDGQEFASEAEAQDHVSSSAAWDDSITGEVIVFSDGHVCLTSADAAAYTKQQLSLGNNVSYSIKGVTNQAVHNAKPWAQSIETWMTYIATLDGTTPLQTFDTMEEAQAWCEARQHQVTSSQQTVTTWKTSDGQEFASEAEAQDHCAEAALVDPVTTSVTKYYASKDGVEHAFDTAKERDAWADANGPSVQKLSRTVTDWDTTATDYFGAQTFSDEEAAKAFVASHTWKVQSFEYYRCRDCGEEFDDELDMAKHLQDTGHSGYNKLWSYTAYCSQASGKSRSFDDEDEANAYAASQTPTYHPVQRDVAYWRTSDGLEFSYEADANYHLSQMGAPRRYEATHDVVSWRTSDGKTFDSQADAENHAEEITPSYSSSQSTRTVWGTDADDQTFPTEQEAYKHAASLSPYAIGQRKQRVVWKTSDGQTFDSEEAARAHGQTLYLTVSKGSRDVVTWHCAGSDYATEAEAEAYSRSLVPVVAGSRKESGWVTSDGKWFATEGEAAAWAQEQNSKGEWRHDSRGWWFASAAGGYPAGCWDEIGGEWYLFDGSGYMLTGWQIAGGRWYWLGTDGAMKTGWQRVNGSWYWLGGLGDGAMATGWAQIDGTWYLLGGSGAMKTGWQKVNGVWYWFDGSGAMATGWQKVGGSWYLLGGSGAMLTDWQQVDGAWYFLDASGAMAHDRWVGNYYVTSSCAMATNQWIDGRWWVGADGKWVG